MHADINPEIGLVGGGGGVRMGEQIHERLRTLDRQLWKRKRTLEYLGDEYHKVGCMYSTVL